MDGRQTTHGRESVFATTHKRTKNQRALTLPSPASGRGESAAPQAGEGKSTAPQAGERKAAPRCQTPKTKRPGISARPQTTIKAYVSDYFFDFDVFLTAVVTGCTWAAGAVAMMLPPSSPFSKPPRKITSVSTS